MKLYPFAGLNISINHYTGMTQGGSASSRSSSDSLAVFANIAAFDFTELYPTIVSVGGLLGTSFRFKLLDRKADVYAMANFSLTNPFAKSIGTDKNNNAMYIDGKFTLFTTGMNVFLKKDKK